MTPEEFTKHVGAETFEEAISVTLRTKAHDEETIEMQHNQIKAVAKERDTLRAEVARLTKERDDASQVSPSEREGILSHISSMLSDAEQEEFGLTGRQLHMQVLRVLSAYRDSAQERDTLAATVATLTQEREEFIRYCQSLQLAHGEVGPIQVARMHIERLTESLGNYKAEVSANVLAASPFQCGGKFSGVLKLGQSTVVEGLKWLFSERERLSSTVAELQRIILQILHQRTGPMGLKVEDDLLRENEPLYLRALAAMQAKGAQ